MELLERYLSEIQKHLPTKEKEETIKELRSLILDQVDETVTIQTDKESVLYTIIQQMGYPRDVASKYTHKKQLISRRLEPTLNLILKIISITLPLTLTFAHTIEYIFDNDMIVVMDLLLSIVYTVPSTLYALLFGYLIIFIAFILIDKTLQPNSNSEFDQALIKEKEFNPSLLPKPITKEFKINSFESITTILVTTLIIYLFNLQQGLISFNVHGATEVLFNSNFEKILVFLNIGWFITIILNLYYLFKRRKSISTKPLN